MSVIWPGLDFIIKSEVVRKKAGESHYCYPFRTYPPPSGFDEGTRHPAMMNVVTRLWKMLRGKHERGGRVRLSSLEIRCAIFAIRVTGSVGRMRARDLRKKIAEEKALLKELHGEMDAHLRSKLAAINISEERFLELRREAALKREEEVRQLQERNDLHGRRTIDSLIRQMKRANRLLLSSVGRPEYESLVRRWQQHVRWMRVHLVHLQPLPPIVRPKRRRQQILDILTEMAIRGLKNGGLAPPEPRELRRVLRLYVRSSNRCREGAYSLHWILMNPSNFDYTFFLAQWVISRTDAELEQWP